MKKYIEVSTLPNFEITCSDGKAYVLLPFKHLSDIPTADIVLRNQWISVEDRLPTDQKDVLCYYGFDRGDGDLGMMFMGVLCYFCYDENPHWQHADHNLVVTHWMPLPTPPTEKES